MTVFFDTNVLIYRIDSRNEAKQRVARQLIKDAIDRGQSLISTQSLQEFYSVATRRLGLHADEAARIAGYYALSSVVQVTPRLIFAAMDRHAGSDFSFWDSLIVEAALAGGAATLYSEDMHDGMKIGALTIRNPFQTP